MTNEAFNAVVENLSAQLDQLTVPAPEKNEVMQLIGTLRSSIVQNACEVDPGTLGYCLRESADS